VRGILAEAHENLPDALADDSAPAALLNAASRLRDISSNVSRTHTHAQRERYTYITGVEPCSLSLLSRRAF
jgi:hypothetical protein